MFHMSKRPVGVTVIAIAMLALGGVGTLMAGVGLLNPPPAPVRPCTGWLCSFDWRPIVFVLASIQAVLSAWALATGAGLLGRFQWARRSAMALSSVPFLLGIFLAGHGGGVIVGLGCLGAGSPLLWYFNRPEVVAWFAERRPDQAAG
jgi:hypothetical protein